MKVRIMFEAGDCVEPEMIGRTFENSGENFTTNKDCDVCAFGREKTPSSHMDMDTACIASCGCDDGVFVEVQDGQGKAVTK